MPERTLAVVAAAPAAAFPSPCFCLLASSVAVASSSCADKPKAASRCPVALPTYRGSAGSLAGCQRVSQLRRASPLTFTVDMWNVCMVKIRTSPARKSAVFHSPPNCSLSSHGSSVNQPVPFRPIASASMEPYVSYW